MLIVICEPTHTTRSQFYFSMFHVSAITASQDLITANFGAKYRIHPHLYLKYTAGLLLQGGQQTVLF